MTIVYWAAGWLAGIWLAAQAPLPGWLRLLIAALALLAAALWRKQAALSLGLLVIGAAALGGLYFDARQPALDQDHIIAYLDAGELQIAGWIAEPPDVHETQQLVTLVAESVTGGQDPPQAVQGQVLVRAPRFPLLAYGTPLLLNGRLEAPQPVDTFDYPAYLARQNIYAVMAFPRITITGAELRGNPLLHALTAVNERAQQTIDELLPNPQAALLKGILLGHDQDLPDPLQDAFRVTGMTHIIAISGFNIAIIAGLLLQTTRLFWNRRSAAWIALAGVALYTLLVGAEASVVRAAIMGGLFIVSAQLLGRPTFAPATLLSAAFLMSLFDPEILWDIGFQLSAAATLGLMLLVEPGSVWLQRHLAAPGGPAAGVRAAGFLGDVVLTTLVAFLFTLPVLLYHFGALSAVSLPANFALLPAQSWLMLWGGLATLLGLVHPLLGQLPAWIDWLFLTYTINGVAFFADLPLTTVPLKLSLPGVLASYSAIAVASWAFLRRARAPAVEQAVASLRVPRRQLYALGGAGLIALLALVSHWRAPDGRLHVLFLDVGQGDAILIQAPSGRQMLVDGGAYPNLLLSRLGETLPFWDRRLDYVVATHPDTDHVAGLAGALTTYRVDQFIGSMDAQGSAVYTAVLQAGESNQVPIREATVGERIVLEEDVVVEVLQSDQDDALSDNDRSVVLRLQYGNFSLLLTGDSEAAAEERLLASGAPLQATVLKAGHHGANTSSSASFLDVVQPQIVVISAGKDNRFNHPHPDALQRITVHTDTVLRTDEMGTIELVSDGRRVWWR